jgi:hypothetical protein
MLGNSQRVTDLAGEEPRELCFLCGLRYATVEAVFCVRGPCGGYITSTCYSLDETERLVQSVYKGSECSRSVLSTRWKITTESSS